MEYLEVLEKLRREQPAPLLPGSPAEHEALERFGRFFADFSPDKIARLLDLTYAEDAWFNDTLKTLRGREQLRDYLRHSAEAVHSCRVQILDRASTAGGDHYLRWTMAIRFRRFKSAQETHSIGMTHLRFDASGRVRLHQDYWDSSAGLFEHIPLLGAGIRAIKRRL